MATKSTDSLAPAASVFNASPAAAFTSAQITVAPWRANAITVALPMPEAPPVTNAIALVTGGASGIGKATVMAFARQGATVICADVNAAAGEALKKEAAGANLKVDFVAIDLGNSDSIRAAAAEVLKRYPRVDILVNAAGWGDIQPYMQNTPEFINRVIAINLAGPAHLTQALLPPMIAANGGKVINIASEVDGNHAVDELRR